MNKTVARDNKSLIPMIEPKVARNKLLIGGNSEFNRVGAPVRCKYYRPYLVMLVYRHLLL